MGKVDYRTVENYVIGSLLYKEIPPQKHKQRNRLVISSSADGPWEAKCGPGEPSISLLYIEILKSALQSLRQMRKVSLSGGPTKILFWATTNGGTFPQGDSSAET